MSENTNEEYNTIDGNYIFKAPQSINHRKVDSEQYNGALAELNRLKGAHNYTGAFNYAMKIQFKGTAKDILKIGLEFYKKNKLDISYKQLQESGIENGFAKEVKDITDTFK